MIRFMLRLVGALLVEGICERIRPAQFPLAPLGEPDGWYTYFHGIRIHPRNTIPKSGAKYALLEHPSARDWFEDDCMVGVSGTTPDGVDVSTPLYPGWYVEREANGTDENPTA